MIINKNIIPLTLSSLACLSLTACGGGSSTSDISEAILSGIAISTENATEVITNGVASPVKLTSDLLFLGNDFDTDFLSVDSSTDVSTTYNCDSEGTITVTEIGTTTSTSSTILTEYDNCVHYDVHYNGDATIQLEMVNGTISDFGTTGSDWYGVQTSVLSDLSRTAPVSGGSTNVINGDIVIASSYDTSTLTYDDLLTSSNLSYNLTSSDNVTTNYNFSELSYNSVEDDSTGDALLSLNFIAEHSDIGDMQMTTESPLSLESSVLQSGTVTFSTGTSAIQLDAVGNDEIDILLDVNGDGDYDFTLPSTTWAILFDAV